MQNDRKRLIELIVNAPKTPILINGIASGKVYQSAEHIADHLLTNGVIVPPCKAGDTVYYELYGEVKSAVIYRCEAVLTQGGIYITQAEAKGNDGIEVYFGQDNIGKTVFLSREDAEDALRRKLPSDVSEKIMKHFTEVE